MLSKGTVAVLLGLLLLVGASIVEDDYPNDEHDDETEVGLATCVHSKKATRVRRDHAKEVRLCGRNLVHWLGAFCDEVVCEEVRAPANKLSPLSCCVNKCTMEEVASLCCIGRR